MQTTNTDLLFLNITKNHITACPFPFPFLQEMDSSLEASSSTTSLEDHVLMNEENEGMLGPVTFAALSERSNKDQKEKTDGYG